MMSVEFAPGQTSRIGRPRALFEFDSRVLDLRGFPLRGYDVSPNGERFVALQREPRSLPAVTHINLMLNWFEELKAKVPTGR